MGVTCKKCNRAINARNAGIKCGKCISSFHYQCANIQEDHLKELQIGAVVWFCTHCRSGDLNSSIIEDDVQQTSKPSKMYKASEIHDLISSVKSDIISEMNKKFETLIRSTDFCSNKITDFEASIKLVSEKLKMLESYKKENEELKNEVYLLNNKINDMEQYSKLNNLIISNYPETRTENVFDIVTSIGESLGVTINNNDMDAAHRLQLNARSKDSRNIVVKFVSRRKKDEFLSNYRRKKNSVTLNPAPEGASSMQSPKMIYINEHLSQTNSLLFKKAREDLRSKGYKFIWTSNCKILAKKDNDASRTHAIRNVSDIAKLS